MTSRDFCYWMQGYFEVSGSAAITEDQAKIIKKHLAMVFKHEIDPSMGDEKHQSALDAIHHAPWPPGATDGRIKC